MATAVGPEGAAPIPIMGDSQAHFVSDDSPATSPDPQASPRPHAPLPNPAFSFPARPNEPSSAPPSFSRASGRRPMTLDSEDLAFSLPAENSESSRRSVALPAFSFNPGASLPPDLDSPLLSPPITPNSPRTSPTGASQQRPPGHGHRRGGSEFVGGRLREGNSIAVMSTSPTKSESGFATPNFQPPRRGHRRGVSSAISTNDLPILLPPPIHAVGKGNSAPNSPTNFEQQDYLSLSAPGLTSALSEPRPVSRHQPDDNAMDVDEPAPKESPKQPRAGTRARVGFSDTLEYIPRPLSMVSSDTSSTATTRPGHSVSESLSSLMSASPGRDSPAPLSRSPTRDMVDSRPSTAGAILQGIQDPKPVDGANVSPRRRNSIPALLDVAESSAVTPPAPSPTKPKRWSFFGLDSFTGSGSPTKTRPCSSSSTESTPRAVSAGSSSEHGSDSLSEPTETASSKHKKSAKKSKKKRKVKGWAGAILPRKPKSQGKRSKDGVVRPPTPPASVVPPDDEEEEIEKEPPVPEVVTPTLTVTESPTPPRPARDDPSYPMIDLDAALGPFNTPLPHNPEWEAAQRAAGNVGKRRLHSAQMMKGFSGPGMHYHRRAESAPDLPPFDAGRSALHRFGSNSTMADVFEEEEEEEDEDSEDKSEMTDQKSQQADDSDGDATPPARLQKTPSLPDTQDATPQMVRRKSSGLSDKDQAGAHSVRTERSRTSLQEDVIAEELPSVIFRTSNMFQTGADSVDRPLSSPRKAAGPKDGVPVDVNTIHIPNSVPMPTSPYSMSHASSYPSPRSPMSVDAQRISTAPSSVADENSFHSLLMGEPGPEVRISVDYDIPSLTSSNSTMTRDSSFIANPRLSQPTLRDQRPVSVSSAAFGRRRSSLVSLSRLISSSHGERSKLSMEVRLDEPDSRKRHSKTKRLGRMMQFWKPSKEDTAT